MAYEVTKLVNGRPYRYRVRSERDAQSGKRRSRWTYLGRGNAQAQPAVAKPRRNAREALLDALERLLDGAEVGDVTAAAVSVEAGVAHGTFYRYFRNRDDAIRALAERLRSTKPPELHSLDRPPADRCAARAALRGWTGALLRTRTQHHGVVRALLALAAHDPQMRAAFLARREAYAQQLRAWLAALAARELIAIGDCDTAAAVLFAMLDGIGREAIATREPLEERRIEMAAELVDRAVFA